MNVCKLAFNYLESKGYLADDIQYELENPNKDDAINQLEILARRGYFSIPTYSADATYDENGNPIWTCKCSIKEIKESFSAKASSKKEAKKEAAYRMLQFVLGMSDD